MNVFLGIKVFSKVIYLTYLLSLKKKDSLIYCPYQIKSFLIAVEIFMNP